MEEPYGGKSYFIKVDFQGKPWSVGKVVRYGGELILFHRDNVGSQPLDNCPSPVDVALVEYCLNNGIARFWHLSFADKPWERELYTISFEQLNTLRGQNRGGRFRVWATYDTWDGPTTLPDDFPDYVVPKDFNVFLPEDMSTVEDVASLD